MKKFSVAGIIFLVIFTTFSTLIVQAAGTDFGNTDQFRVRWQEQDALVGTTGVSRPYTWGPNVAGVSTSLTEAYQGSPNGQRQVLYFDKARMEINNPANGFVTTGLVVKELVSGMRQDGDNTFSQLPPSQTQVAGDAVSVNPNAPVYASFKNVVTLGNADSHSKPSAVGATLNQMIAKDGSLSTITPPENLTVGTYQAQTGHNIAKAFQDFMFQHGAITNPANGAVVTDQPLYTANPTSNVFGLAISEPYWAHTKVAGKDQTVLVQLFERRVLTYNPALAANKVEMGNLGQHYYQWRYVENKNGGSSGPVSTKPTPTPTTGGSNVDTEETSLLNLINQYRQANGKPTLTFNQTLITSAKWMSTDMATKNYFSHVDSQGRDPFQRMAAFGYTANTYKAENIAAGYTTAAEVIAGWKASPGHNTNMLDGDMHVAGIGRANNPNSTYKWYWTLDLGGQ